MAQIAPPPPEPFFFQFDEGHCLAGVMHMIRNAIAYAVMQERAPTPLEHNHHCVHRAPPEPLQRVHAPWREAKQRLPPRRTRCVARSRTNAQQRQFRDRGRWRT